MAQHDLNKTPSLLTHTSITFHTYFPTTYEHNTASAPNSEVGGNLGRVDDICEYQSQQHQRTCYPLINRRP